MSAAARGLPSPFILDFDAFLIAGRAALRGTLAQAYGMEDMQALEAALGLPHGKWLPYTYPPTATLLFPPLSSLPSILAFLGFEALSLIVFLTGLTSLGARGTRVVITLSSVPVVCLNLRAGQNGLLLAGLAAHGAKLWLADRPVRAGFVAALATFKPHLALGLPLAMIWAREARGFASFLATTFLLVALSVLAFGPSSWPSFFHATSLAGSNLALALGLFPMARLSSAYAFAYGLGVRGLAPWLFHAFSLLVVTAATLAALRQSCDRRILIGLSIAWATYVSPYVYDYDLAILSVVAAILSEPLHRRLGGHVTANMLGVLLVSQIVGLAWWILGGRAGVASGLLLPLILFVSFAISRRSPLPSSPMTTPTSSLPLTP